MNKKNLRWIERSIGIVIILALAWMNFSNRSGHSNRGPASDEWSDLGEHVISRTIDIPYGFGSAVCRIIKIKDKSNASISCVYD